MARKQISCEARFALLAAKWAANLQLPIGSLWEASLTRYMEREWRRLGADESAYGLVRAMAARRLGIDDEGENANGPK